MTKTGRLELVLFAAVIAIQLAPIWTLGALPTQDGPSHRAMASLVRAYDRPDSAFLREYFVKNPNLSPNAFVYFVLARVFWFVDLPTAEKCLLTLYVVLFPLSLRYALRADGPRRTWLSWLAFPFTYNWTLQMGFFNFACSVAAFLFALGYWRRHGAALRGWRWFAFALGAFGVYLCHVVSFVMLIVVVAALAGWDAWTGRASATSAAGGARGGRLVQSALRGSLGQSLAAFVPAGVLLALFMGRQQHMPIATAPLLTKLRHLADLDALIAIDIRSVVGSGALVFVLAGTAALLFIRRLAASGRATGDGYLVAIGASLLTYLAAPSQMSSGGYLLERLSLYPFLLTILWIGTREVGPNLKRLLMSAGAGVGLGLLALFWPRWQAIDRSIEDLNSAGAHVAAGSTLACLVYAPHGIGDDGREMAYRTKPFLHACGAIAATRPIVDLLSYEAHFELFPYEFRPGRDPYLIIGRQSDLERDPPHVDLAAYRRVTGKPIDYVLLWQADAAAPADPDVQSVRDQLAAGYERVYVSPRRGAELYRVRP